MVSRSVSGSFRIIEHDIPCQHIREYPSATANTQEDTMHLAVKQYIPHDNPVPHPGDMTILASHGSGLEKELYEPLWEDLHLQSRNRGLRIRSIWMADVATQGQSGVWNEPVLGDDPNWSDHARDLLHLVNLKRAEMPEPIVGIGHSMGGAQLIQLSIFHARLFHTIILLDPVIQRPVTRLSDHDAFTHDNLIQGFTQFATYRQDRWPSREAAAAFFTRVPLFRSWDPRVFDKWVNHGLRETPLNPDPPTGEPEQLPDSPPVTLKTSPRQEALAYARPLYDKTSEQATGDCNSAPDCDPSLTTSFPFYRPEPSVVFSQLPFVRPSILYVFARKSPLRPRALHDDKLHHTGTGVGGSGGPGAGRVKMVNFEDLGHLMAQESPRRVADTALRWMVPEIRRWKNLHAESAVWAQETDEVTDGAKWDTPQASSMGAGKARTTFKL